MGEDIKELYRQYAKELAQAKELVSECEGYQTREDFARCIIKKYEEVLSEYARELAKDIMRFL